MRLRTLETNAGTVLVLDQATAAEVEAQRTATMDGWIARGGPFIFTLAGDVEIPESDNYHPPRDAKPDNPLIERLRRQGVSL